jgi:hypothetical protein
MIASNARWTKRNASPRESFHILALLSIVIAAPASLMIHLLEPDLVLAAFSLLLFLGAAVAAIVARRNSNSELFWDIAGAFTMIGCAAVIFSEPDQVAMFFEQRVERDSDAAL